MYLVEARFPAAAECAYLLVPRWLVELSRIGALALSRRDGRDLWRFAHASNP